MDNQKAFKYKQRLSLSYRTHHHGQTQPAQEKDTSITNFPKTCKYQQIKILQ